MPDFEGLEEAKKLLISPKKRRLEAGVDVMLTSQGPSTEQKRRKNKRRIERMDERKVGLKDNLKKMKEMAEEGDEARQNSLTLIIPRTGKSAKKSKLSAPEKAKQKLRISFLRRKAQAKAKAQGKAKANVEYWFGGQGLP